MMGTRPAVPGFYDFFCDSAIAGAGLEQEWQCSFANDVYPREGRARPHFGGASCLRARGGGSSRQFLIVVDGNETRMRLVVRARRAGSRGYQTRMICGRERPTPSLLSAMASLCSIAFVALTDRRQKGLLAQDRATGAAGEKRVTYDRSAVMRAVKSRDTSPERAVRALLRPIAPGYRLHRADLPSKPDIVYRQRKLAIFVHGCFWHGHGCARGARSPKANADYWRAKIARNRARDEKTLAAYAGMGWRALVIFECELKDKAALSARLADALRLQ